MVIDENTKLVGRFHPKVSPRSLNIYNPFFQEVGLNAVYLLFTNDDPKVLVDSMRSLNMVGAVNAGFESKEGLLNLFDSLDETSEFLGKVGYISNEDGKIVGHAQGGLGMLKTIKLTGDFEGKKIIIAGAGGVAKGLLFEIEKSGIKCDVVISNRNVEKANDLKNRFSFVSQVLGFDDINSVSGDVFVNLTHIGGRVTDFSYPEIFLQKFEAIVDVTFEIEETELIKSAKKLNKKYATGWDMFTNQGLVVMEGIFKQDFDFDILKKHVVAGLSQVVK